ncbi:hypothetical protein ACFFRR_002161 [Megaselia abdita]
MMEHENCCEIQMKSKMQNNSVAPSALVIMATSMPLPSYFSAFEEDIHLYQINFNIACIIGALFGAYAIRQTSKNLIHIVTSILTIVSGIVFCASPNYFMSMVLFRYLQGLAFGVATVTILTTASEVAQTKYRGIIASLEPFSIATGYFTYSIIASSLVDDGSLLDSICGYLIILYGAIALLTIIISVESPLYLLSQNKEEDALLAIQKLQKEETLTKDVFKQYYEIKDLIADDKTRTFKKNLQEGIVPFIKITVIRCLNSLTFNFLVMSTSSGFETYMQAIYGSGRWISVLLTTFFMIESVGRRKLLASSCIMSTVNLLVIVLVNSGIDSYIWIPIVFLQFFNGFGQVSTAVYMGEAFSVSVKPLYIFLILLLENLVEIIIAATCYDIFNTLYYASLFILFACSIPFSLYMFPETAGLPLKESRWKFLNWITKF